MACPHLGVRCRLLVGGVRSPRRQPKGCSFHPGGYRLWEDRTGELLEPSLMPRYARSRPDGTYAGCRDWPLRSGRRRPAATIGRDEHRRPWGIEGAHPGRSSCVRNAVTPSGSEPMVR
jgi:hypothetical protein